MMDSDNVLSLLAAIRDAGLDVWVGGGWGIDALLGEQTRPHRDLDLMHRAEQEPRLLDVLGTLGYAETLDWRPVRFVMTGPDGLDIDLHPLRFNEDGSAEQSSMEEGEPFRYPADCFVHRDDRRPDRTVPVCGATGPLPPGLRADRTRPRRHGAPARRVRHPDALLTER